MIVFVSYSSRNRKRVEELVLQLGQLGHDVQFESKLIGGDVPWQQVFDSIATSDLFITTLSGETLVSYTSRIENEYARDLNKYVLFVALDEFSSFADLDAQILASTVDFSESNPTANEALAAAMSSFVNLEPRPVAEVPQPNWEASLAELRQNIQTENGDPAEQGAILLNLREFLERHETFAAAKNMLTEFSARNNLRPEIRNQSRRLLSQAKHVGSLLQKIQRRGIFYGAIILSLLVSLAVVLLSQVVLQFRAQRGVTARLTSTALTLRADTATFTPKQTQGAAVTTFTPLAPIISPTLITSSPEVTSTEILPATRDAVVSPIILSPDVSLTDIPSTATPVAIFTQTLSPVSTLGTATSIPLVTNTPRLVTGTAVAQVIATITKQPSTATPLQPTLTSTATSKPSSTPAPVTNVPVTAVPTSVTPQSLAFVPTIAPTLNFNQILPQSVYVGMDVEDTLFGVQVTAVGTTAKTAGVQIGDYILAINLDTIKAGLEFFRVMEMQNPSSTITLRMRRDNRTVVVSLVLGVSDFALSYPG